MGADGRMIVDIAVGALVGLAVVVAASWIFKEEVDSKTTSLWMADVEYEDLSAAGVAVYRVAEGFERVMIFLGRKARSVLVKGSDEL